jgi:hypothetical protein
MKGIKTDKGIMNRYNLFVIMRQANVLRKLLPQYSGKTIDNVLSQLEARIKYSNTTDEL